MRTHIGTLQGVTVVAALLTVVATTTFAQAPAAPRRAPGERILRRASPDQPGAQRVTANRAESAPSQLTDRQIANWLAICNQEEVEMGKLASSKAKNEKVREFADHLVKGHNELLTQLQQFGASTIALRQDNNAPDANAAAPAAPSNADRDANVARTDRQQVQTRTAASGQGGLDFLAVKRQIAQHCLETAQKEWNDKGEDKAAECDMAFVGQQIVAHQQMLGTQKILKQYASPELQMVIDKGIQSTEDHLAQAKDLIHQLDKNVHESAKDSRDSKD